MRILTDEELREKANLGTSPSNPNVDLGGVHQRKHTDNPNKYGESYGYADSRCHRGKTEYECLNCPLPKCIFDEGERLTRDKEFELLKYVAEIRRK